MVAWEPKLVALVLPANFAALGDDVEQIQWDVMDGCFDAGALGGGRLRNRHRARRSVHHLHRTLARIRELGADIELEVAGGIGPATIADAAAARASVFCAGSAAPAWTRYATTAHG